MKASFLCSLYNNCLIFVLIKKNISLSATYNRELYFYYSRHNAEDFYLPPTKKEKKKKFFPCFSHRLNKVPEGGNRGVHLARALPLSNCYFK